MGKMAGQNGQRNPTKMIIYTQRLADIIRRKKKVKYTRRPQVRINQFLRLFREGGADYIASLMHWPSFLVESLTS